MPESYEDGAGGGDRDDERLLETGERQGTCGTV